MTDQKPKTTIVIETLAKIAPAGSRAVADAAPSLSVNAVTKALDYLKRQGRIAKSITTDFPPYDWVVLYEHPMNEYLRPDWWVSPEGSAPMAVEQPRDDNEAGPVKRVAVDEIISAKPEATTADTAPTLRADEESPVGASIEPSSSSTALETAFAALYDDLSASSRVDPPHLTDIAEKRDVLCRLSAMVPAAIADVLNAVEADLGSIAEYQERS